MIVGHQKQWEFLKNKFESGQLSHAYLFIGEKSIGKKIFAKEFIKLINCQSEDKRPCQKCRICESIERGNYPDFLMIKLKDGEREIQIFQAREAQNFLSYKSYYNSYKAVIINDAELMNNEAQSCFLKTLEEPKGKTILILISSNSGLLLPTIYSRCQIVKFFPQKLTEIKNYLKNRGVDEKKAQMISEISRGKIGVAENFILNPDKLEKEKNILQQLLKAVNSGLAEKFQYAKSIDFEKDNLKEILEVFQSYLRHLLFLKSGIKKHGDVNYFPVSENILSEYPAEKIKKILNFTEEINFKITATNASPKLALEMLLLEI